MFKLRIRNLNESYGTTKEHLVADFLQAIGFFTIYKMFDSKS